MEIAAEILAHYAEGQEHARLTSRPSLELLRTRVLLERFAGLGWNPEGYKTSMLEVCSLFCRRRIVSVRGMQPAELARLSGELEGIWKHAHPDARVTALADARIEWRESWQREDPEAFAQYEAGQ